jgi:hypothetical protein
MYKTSSTVRWFSNPSDWYQVKFIEKSVTPSGTFDSVRFCFFYRSSRNRQPRRTFEKTKKNTSWMAKTQPLTIALHAQNQHLTSDAFDLNSVTKLTSARDLNAWHRHVTSTCDPHAWPWCFVSSLDLLWVINNPIPVKTFITEQGDGLCLALK